MALGVVLAENGPPAAAMLAKHHANHLANLASARRRPSLPTAVFLASCDARVAVEGWSFARTSQKSADAVTFRQATEQESV
jgi:hypothetical protein